MAERGFPTFTTTVDRTNRVLKEIEEAFGWPKERRNQSYAALRGVLHAIRDRLTVEEAAQFGAQLPMLVRGLFYEGWAPHRVPLKMSKEQFFARVRQEFPFDVHGGIEQVVRTVAQVIKGHVAEGEWRDVAAEMPADLAAILS